MSSNRLPLLLLLLCLTTQLIRAVVPWWALHTDRELSASENFHSVPTKPVNEGQRVNNTEGIEDPCERLDEAGSPCRIMTPLESSPPLPCFNIHFTTKWWIQAGAPECQRASGAHSEEELRSLGSAGTLPWPLPSQPQAVSRPMHSPVVGWFRLFVELSFGHKSKQKLACLCIPLPLVPDVSDFSFLSAE